MDPVQFEEIKRLLEQNNAMAQERLLMEKELFEARKLSLHVGNQHMDAAGKLAVGALKIQPFAVGILVALCGLILYLAIFKI
jgi:hypothetical protein